jgi:hypothetical protein
MAKKRGKLFQQVIGKITSSPLWSVIFRQNVDKTVPDYEFWDKFRHGLQTGYERIGANADGLIETVVAHVVADGFKFALDTVDDKRMLQKAEHTNSVLSRFGETYKSEIIKLLEDECALGDQYVIISPDGSLVFPSPDAIQKLREDKNDPYKVTTVRYTVIDEGTTIIEEFTDTERRKIIKRGDLKTPVMEVFPNLIGRIPVALFHFDRGRNELYGRPIYSSLRTLFADYEDLVTKGMAAGKLTGNPMPVFEGMLDVEETVDLNTTKNDTTYVDEEGNDETRRELKWDETAALFIGEGGTFKFASPEPGFAKDIETLIDVAFRIIQNKTHAPDHVWGGGESTTSSQAEAARPAFGRYINRLRVEFAGRRHDEYFNSNNNEGLLGLLDIWLRVVGLFDPKILIHPTVINWYGDSIETERIVFEKVKWAHSRVLITDETALALMNFSVVEDTNLEIEEARLESDEKTDTTEFDDFAGEEKPLTEDLTPDERADNGADAPRMPATGGGGRL